MQLIKVKRWEDDIGDLHNLLVACVGHNYGPNPEEKIDKIRESRGAYWSTIAERLSLTKADTVLDMGSGCGFIARAMAPYVKQIHCADLNEGFLQICKAEVSQFDNVVCHLVRYADFTALRELRITKVYSTAVWIHFNFYDFILNLRALNEILPVGGLLYFDYADAQGLKVSDRLIFNTHLRSFEEDKTFIRVHVQYTSDGAVRAAADMTGFEVKDIKPVWEECYGATLVKIATL
jgi:predicted TPR repeat methyltransferase